MGDVICFPRKLDLDASLEALIARLEALDAGLDILQRRLWPEHYAAIDAAETE